MDQTDVEKIILMVRDRPILWDTSSELYKDRSQKRTMWTEICASLNKNFLDRSEEDQEITSKLFIYFLHITKNYLKRQ